jgi:hypothetical protein
VHRSRPAEKPLVLTAWCDLFAAAKAGSSVVITLTDRMPTKTIRIVPIALLRHLGRALEFIARRIN